MCLASEPDGALPRVQQASGHRAFKKRVAVPLVTTGGSHESRVANSTAGRSSLLKSVQGLRPQAVAEGICETLGLTLALRKETCPYVEGRSPQQSHIPPPSLSSCFLIQNMGMWLSGMSEHSPWGDEDI